MSLSLAQDLNGRRRPEAWLAGFAARHEIGLAVALGGLLFLAMTLPKAVAVWHSGMFYNPDDAMRAVEVRDLMAGQGWFDLVPHRLAPSHPFDMHWSRLLDLMLATSNRLFGLVAQPATAERLTRLAEPAALALLFLATAARLARDLVGPGGGFATAALAAGALDVVGDFLPGHIHHHGLQQVLLLLMVKALCDGFDPARPRRMALAGLFGALSLGVNLQNMPFVAATAGFLVLVWIQQGPAFDRALRAFAGGLVATGIAVFLAEVPPQHYLHSTCDAFAAPHLLAAAAGGLAVLGLTRLSGRLHRIAFRFAAAAGAGAALLALLAATYPGCLGDPYGAVDPLLRTRWLKDVGEAMPIGRLLLRDPAGTLPILLTLGLGLAAAALAATQSRGVARLRWSLIGFLGLVGLAGSFWEVRVAASAEALGLAGAAFLFCRIILPNRAGKPLAAFTCCVAALALTQAGWTAVLPQRLFASFAPAHPSTVANLPALDPEACFAPESYAGLNSLPTGLVLSTIDPGAHILAYTHHGALAAPYHRNAFGNRLALLAFAAKPDEAQPMLEAAGVDYVALCTTSPETRDFAIEDPQGLAAELLRGTALPWLTPVAEEAGPFKVFALRLPQR